MRLQNFFNNKGNLKERWTEVMLKEVQWFMSHLVGTPVQTLSGLVSDPLCISLDCRTRHFEKQCDALLSHNDEVMDVQDILRALRLHEGVIKILEVGLSESGLAADMNATLYAFLVAFCENNPKNQAALYSDSSIRLFALQLRENVVWSSFWWL